MKVCIAGGGRVGMYLAQSLLSHHHKVTIIEPQEALCRTLADTLDIPVICGDSLSFDTLRTADVASCDAFVAVTNTDETNLVACQIAKREFGVNRTVARASNPKNRDILHTLGVDTVVYGTDNLSGAHKLPSVMWSAEYQNEYLEMTHAVFDHYDFVQGELVWNFADFQTTEGILRVDGNKKGIFTRQRQPKDAAYLFRERWTTLPVDFKKRKK